MTDFNKQKIQYEKYLNQMFADLKKGMKIVPFLQKWENKANNGSLAVKYAYNDWLFTFRVVLLCEQNSKYNLMSLLNFGVLPPEWITVFADESILKKAETLYDKILEHVQYVSNKHRFH